MALVILGSVFMMRASSFGFAYAAAVLACIPLCGPCCILGVPFGIWAIVVLNDPDVKREFR